MPTLGLTGKPNVGKSTFFSAATLASIPIANFPFTTKVANLGTTYVSTQCVCKEFNIKDNPVNSTCIDGTRLVPVKLIDCPGLVSGAWQGRGLGNQFLDDVRKADALLLVIDVAGATDNEGRPCAPGENDPLEDLKFLETEFDMWINQILKKDWEKLTRKVEMLKENFAATLYDRLAGLQIKRHHINQAIDKLDLSSKKVASWEEEDVMQFASELRKASKPILVVANKVDLPHADENIERLRGEGYMVVPCCAEAELALRRASEKGLINYNPGAPDFEILKEAELKPEQYNALSKVKNLLDKFGSTGVQEALNYTYFTLLDMIAVFPVEDQEHLSDHKGRVLPDCYLVPRGTTARELAEIIHTELSENFIYAVEVRTKKRTSEDYVLKPKDVIRIVSAKARA
jgi:ribosome-binding ATPase YchF (GTP1/OBG family)